MEVYYQSSRCFGQHGINVDIALVEHANFGILELITHEVNVNAEAPRIYLDMALLKSAIQPSKLETRVNAMREPLLRLREVVNEQTILQTATKNAIIELLLGQLVIMEYNAEARSFVVGIGSSIVNCVCPAPTNLAPYKMVHKAQPPTEKGSNRALGGIDMQVLHHNSCPVQQPGVRTSTTEPASRHQESTLATDKEEEKEEGKHSPRPDSKNINHRPVPPSRGITPFPSSKNLTGTTTGTTGTAALSFSLERSLSNVADKSINTGHKCYRPDANLNSDESPALEEPPQAHQYAHLLTSLPPRKSSGAGLGTDSQQNLLGHEASLIRAPSDLHAQLSRRSSSRSNLLTPRHSPLPSPRHSPRPSHGGISGSHPHAHPSNSSGNHAQQHHTRHSAEQLTPRRPSNNSQPLTQQQQPQEGEQFQQKRPGDVLDITELGFKQRTAPKARPLTAAEKANNDLMLSRMMATVAAVGQSIRSSFSRSSAKVHVVAVENSARTTTTCTTSTALSSSASVASASTCSTGGVSVDNMKVVSSNIDVDEKTPMPASANIPKPKVKPKPRPKQSPDVPVSSDNGNGITGTNTVCDKPQTEGQQSQHQQQPQSAPGENKKHRVVRFFELLTGR